MQETFLSADFNEINGDDLGRFYNGCANRLLMIVPITVLER